MAPRAGGAKSGVALRKQRILCPKTAFFGPKRPRNPLKTAKRREMVATLYVCLHCLVTNSPFLPFNSTTCSRGPKVAKSGLSVRWLCETRPKPRTGRIPWATWLKTDFRAHLPSPSAICHFFVVSKPEIRPTIRLDPRTSGDLVEPEGSPARARLGPTMGPPRSPGRKKIIFFQSCWYTTWHAPTSVLSPF